MNAFINNFDPAEQSRSAQMAGFEQRKAASAERDARLAPPAGGDDGGGGGGGDDGDAGGGGADKEAAKQKAGECCNKCTEAGSCWSQPRCDKHGVVDSTCAGKCEAEQASCMQRCVKRFKIDSSDVGQAGCSR